jgi:hypothetical protein
MGVGRWDKRMEFLKSERGRIKKLINEVGWLIAVFFVFFYLKNKNFFKIKINDPVDERYKNQATNVIMEDEEMKKYIEGAKKTYEGLFQQKFPENWNGVTY